MDAEEWTTSSPRDKEASSGARKHAFICDEPKSTVVLDTRTTTLGHVMDEYLGHIRLRPLHGGPDWTLPAGRVRPATEEEVGADRD